MSQRRKQEMESTDNPSVYRKARKEVLARTGEINCDRCPYHGIENASKPDHAKPKRKDHR